MRDRLERRLEIACLEDVHRWFLPTTAYHRLEAHENQAASLLWRKPKLASFPLLSKACPTEVATQGETGFDQGIEHPPFSG
jgi:hypothetical protein